MVLSGGSDLVDELSHCRTRPLADLALQAEDVARTCRSMAERFHRGGKLVVFGNGGPSTDAQHVAVEFVHPVIVGKRALPALSLTSDVATLTGIANRCGYTETFAQQIRCLTEPADIVMGLSADGQCRNVLRGLEVAKELGLLTVALVGGSGGAISASRAADHLLAVRSADPLVVKEVHVTMYHLLWELVHVFLERPDMG
ncbi:D-sedoheptulose-7-phosphate isomerase [Allokutzneria albata]|uniref:D-sedoheptulose-7-phosphate isomerase n=1 Tax=Allokutzneria albata TaxID=211114 RepID=UPI0004C45C20